MFSKYVYSNDELLELISLKAKYYVVYIIDKNLRCFVECISTDGELLNTLSYLDLQGSTMFDEIGEAEESFSIDNIIRFCKYSGIVSIVNDDNDIQKELLKIFVSDSLGGADHDHLPFVYDNSEDETYNSLSEVFGVDLKNLIYDLKDPDNFKNEGTILNIKDYVINNNTEFNRKINAVGDMVFISHSVPGKLVIDEDGKIVYDTNGEAVRKDCSYSWDLFLCSENEDADPDWTFDDTISLDSLVKVMEGVFDD